jgi:hypothetical protein
MGERVQKPAVTEAKKTTSKSLKAKVTLDYDKLVSEYGRNLADHMMAEQQAADDVETR